MVNYISSGILRYSPKLLGGKSDKWWAICDADAVLGKYYRHLYYLSTNRCYKMQRPAWDAHITVIRDEEPLNKQFWEKYNGLELEFEVVSNVETNGDYYWISVKCNRALEIREELGLPRDPIIPLHVSIGHGVY